MSILFIALQCFQCSTMQVRQQKKSSNKWVCIICNEKQSMRKIYCQSYRAKDVREFVQGFNSRRLNGRLEFSRLIEPPGECGSDGAGGGPKRMDWSEYLDVEEHGKEKEDDDNGVLVTTEMSTEKSVCHTPAASKNLKPKFSKRRVNESKQGNSGSLKCSRTEKQKIPSKWSRYLEKEEDEEVGLKFDGNGNENGLIGEERIIDGLVVEEEAHPDFV